MAAAKMRHFNSPEEIALRAGQPAASKGKDFRHYNHPDEVARRAAAGQSSAVIAPQRVRPQQPAGAWPPEGESNNAPVETPVVLVDAVEVELNEKPDTVPPPAARTPNDERLRRLENILFTFCESTAEARHFRMLLSNQQAVTDSQQDLVNRMRAVESTLDQALEDDEDDDVEPAEPAPPTRDDNGTPEGA